MTAEFERYNDNVKWVFYDFLSKDEYIRFDYRNHMVIDELPNGLFRPVLARLGYICIGSKGLYGGHGLFKIVNEKP